MPKLASNALVIVTLVVVHASAAQTIRTGSVSVEAAWARASVPNAASAAAYVTLSGIGSTADRLESVSTPVARRAELHGHRMLDGVMKMERLEGLDITPGTTVELKPGGLHVMLMGLQNPLVAGDRFALSLQFEHAGPVTVEVTVQDLASTSYEAAGEELQTGSSTTQDSEAKPAHAHGATGKD